MTSRVARFRRARARACVAATTGLRKLGDPCLLALGLPFGMAVLLAFGMVAAIIPNPVFGRSIPPEPFAIAVWLVSAPLAGLILATYVVAPAGPGAEAVPLNASSAGSKGRRPGDGTTLGSLGGFAAFVAIGCPLCNKLVLVLLGTTGALSIFAPIQPVIGVASVILLAATLLWRLHLRESGVACPI